MPERNAVPAGERPRLEQWILHACHLLLHRFKGLANHRRPHLLGTQVTDFFDLQEVEKRVILSGGYQSGFFPTCQLTRREPQDPKQVRSTISVHGCLELLLPLSGSPLCVGKWKPGKEGISLNTATKVVQVRERTLSGPDGDQPLLTELNECLC